MEFAREPLTAILESGLEPLLRAHWSEVAHDKDVIVLNPDWAEYFDQERAGRFVAFSLRDDGDLVGYTAFFIVRSLHYRDHVFAMNDVIYLRPETRGVEGLRMVLRAEAELRKAFVTKVFYHVKADALLGMPEGDSLAAVEAVMAVEQEFDIEIPDAAAGDDRTLGGVLRALGYRHVENHFGKLLKEKP